MESDRDRILAAGIDACITKPLDKTLLHDMIRRYAPPDCGAIAGLKAASG
jgi:CheY-like chemotaxis protein